MWGGGQGALPICAAAGSLPTHCVTRPCDARSLPPSHRPPFPPQVTVPPDLQALDLTLTSARVKLKRVYTGSLPPPKGSGLRAPIAFRVAVAAVIDNMGGKRLEVIASCPDIAARLAKMHRARKEGPTDARALRRRFDAAVRLVEDMCGSVGFVP